MLRALILGGACVASAHESLVPKGDPALPTCIVGGGIGGVAVADYLKQHAAATPTIIFEREALIGGNIRSSDKGAQAPSDATKISKTKIYARDGDGVSSDASAYILGENGAIPQELGACYTSPDYARVMALLEELGLTEQLITVPSRWVHSAAGAAGEALAAFTAKFLVAANKASLSEACQEATSAADPKCQAEVVAIVVKKLSEYENKHAALFGAYGSGSRLPPIDDLTQIAGTFGAWLDANELTELRPILKFFQTSQGYGDLDKIPAYYGLLWSTPTALKLTKQQLTGVTDGTLDPKILAPGFAEMIDRLALRGGAEIRLETTVLRVSRGVDGVNAIVTLKDGAYDIVNCGRVVINVPVPEFQAAKLLDETPEETAIFDDLGNCNEWRTFLLRAEPGKLGAVDTWPSNYEEQGKLVTTRFTPRILDVSEADDGAEEFIALTLNAAGVTEDAAYASVETELAAQGATGVTKVDSFSAPNYNCRFSEAGIQDRKPWKLDELQGVDGIFYVGGSVIFEAMEPILAYVTDDDGVGAMILTHVREAEAKRRKWLMYLACAVAAWVITSLLTITIAYGTHVQHKRQRAELQAQVDGVEMAPGGQVA